MFSNKIFSDFCLLLLVAAIPLYAQSDQNSDDEEMDHSHFSSFPIVRGDSGYLEATWVDDRDVTKEEGVRFVLGKKGENTHVISIYLNMKTNRISIRADYGRWKTSKIGKGIVANDCFSIDTNEVSYAGSTRFGNAHIPIRFNLKEMVSTPPHEFYPIYSALEGSNGEVIMNKDYDMVSLSYPFAMPNEVRWSTFLGSLYKWNGWGGKQLDCRILFTSTIPQDRKRRYYFGSIQLFTYDPEKDDVTNIPSYDDLRISNVNVVTKEIDGLYKQFINFRVTFKNPPPLLLDFNIYEDVGDSGWQLKYGCQITHFYTPTWWLPVIDILK